MPRTAKTALRPDRQRKRPAQAGAGVTSKRDSNPGQVRVLARGLSVLRAFAPRNAWLSNHEIAALTSLPRPTVSRLTANLTALGYLQYSTQARKYRLGLSVLALGFSALANVDVRVLARPLLQRLADEEEAPVVLASRDGMTMVANEVCHCRKSIFSLRVNVGSRLTLPYSATGLALLSAMAPAEREDVIREISTRFERNWPQLRKSIDAAIEQYRRYGFCTALGTLESGINGIAVVIDTPGAPHSYTIGAAGPSHLFPVERLEKDLAPKLLAIRRDLEARLAAFTADAGES
mgnify:CR=1 FL=1